MQQCWYSAWLSCAEPFTDYLVLSRGSWYRTNQVTDQRCHFNRAINEPSRSFQNPCRRLLVTYNRLAVWLVKILKAVSTDHCRKASHFTVLTMFKRPLSKRMSIDLSKEEPLEVRAGGLLWSKWIFTKVRWQLYCHYIGPWTRAWPLRSRDNQLHNAPSADTAAAAFIEIRT